MKGFLLAVALIGGAFYLIHSSGSSKGAGKFYESANGVPIEVTPSNVDWTVTHNEAPVLAYFWAPW